MKLFFIISKTLSPAYYVNTMKTIEHPFWLYVKNKYHERAEVLSFEL